MQLRVEVRGEPHLLNAPDVAGPWAEPDPVQHMCDRFGVGLRGNRALALSRDRTDRDREQAGRRDERRQPANWAIGVRRHTPHLDQRGLKREKGHDPPYFDGITLLSDSFGSRLAQEGTGLFSTDSSVQVPEVGTDLWHLLARICGKKSRPWR